LRRSHAFQTFYFASNQIVNDLRMATDDPLDMIAEKINPMPASKAVLSATRYNALAVARFFHEHPIPGQRGCIQETWEI